MAICSPSLSTFGVCLGIWGVIQLGLMGLFYHMRSVAFLEDVAEVEAPERVEDLPKFYEELEDNYSKGAINCWIAAGMYLVVTLFSLTQVWANSRASKVK